MSNWLIRLLYFVIYIVLLYSLSMKRFEGNNVRFLINGLFSCREKSLRFKHHITLLTHYQTRKVVPRGFQLKFHSGTVDADLQLN